MRGNGKIIQELESDFRGAGWNVIKVVWGTHWDPLLARDKKGILMKRMMECVDGEYQTFKSKDGAYVREYFFNTPELKDHGRGLVRRRHLAPEPRRPRSAQDLRGLSTPRSTTRGQPTVHPRQDHQGLSAWATSGEAQNITHQQKKMSVDSLRVFRDRFQIPVPDDKLDEVPYVTFRRRLGGARSTCARGAWSWAATCRRAGARPTR